MEEKGNLAWKVAALACAALLVGAAVAIVILALNRGEGGEEKTLRERAASLESQIEELEQEIADLQGQLARAEAEAEEKDAEAEEKEEATSKPSDRDQLEALGEGMIDENYHVGEIVIDGDWARVGLAPNDPSKYQGDLAYFHKINGKWTFVDMGTGLQYGDIPGAPASIFP